MLFLIVFLYVKLVLLEKFLLVLFLEIIVILVVILKWVRIEIKRCRKVIYNSMVFFMYVFRFLVFFLFK